MIEITKYLTVLMHVEPPKGIPELEGFVRKDEFHVTLLGFKAVSTLNQALEDGKLEQLLMGYDFDALCPLWAPKPGFTMVTMNRPLGLEKSVIQWGDLLGLREFYEWLATATGVTIVPPPAHCTVLVQMIDGKPSFGIGIESRCHPLQLFETLR